jgi:hypothetical protein
MLIYLTGQFSHQILIQLLLSLLHLCEQVHYLALASVRNHSIRLLNNFFCDVNVSTHILRAHSFESLLLIL